MSSTPRQSSQGARVRPGHPLSLSLSLSFDRPSLDASLPQCAPASSEHHKRSSASTKPTAQTGAAVQGRQRSRAEASTRRGSNSNHKIQNKRPQRRNQREEATRTRPQKRTCGQTFARSISPVGSGSRRRQRLNAARLAACTRAAAETMANKLGSRNGGTVRSVVVDVLSGSGSGSLQVPRRTQRRRHPVP